MIPPLTQFGVLPIGIHDSTFAEVETRFVVNEHRRLLWTDFQRYLAWVHSLSFFSTMFIGGSFVTNDTEPDDIDVALSWSKMPRPGIDRLPIAQAMQPNYTKPRFRVQAWPAPTGIPLMVFTKMTAEEAHRRGASPGTEKGVLRTIL